MKKEEPEEIPLALLVEVTRQAWLTPDALLRKRNETEQLRELQKAWEERNKVCRE